MTKREADLAVLSCSSRCRKLLGKRVSYYRYINQKKIGRADVDLHGKQCWKSIYRAT